MRLPRRKFLHAAAGIPALLTLSGVASAVSYPTRPVHIVVGFPAGTAPDIIARLMAEWLSERLGQQFIVDDRPGAASNIATEFVAAAAPDGYTLFIPVSTNAVNATLYKNLNYDFVRDIAPVASIGSIPFVMVSTPSLPVKTLPEFIAYAKANPGRVYMGTQGIGTTPHVCGELLKMMLNTAIGAGLIDSKLQSKFVALGVEPRAMTPVQFGEFIAAEIAKWAKVIDFAGIKPE
jgi:tripartite-type tricarboxylate transporter receptor subunit TctC